MMSMKNVMEKVPHTRHIVLIVHDTYLDHFNLREEAIMVSTAITTTAVPQDSGAHGTDEALLFGGHRLSLNLNVSMP